MEQPGKLNKVKLDADGFPIPSALKADTIEVDEDGLPVPVKKKDAGISPSADSTLDYSDPLKPEKQVTSLESSSPFQADRWVKPQLKITTPDGFDIPVNPSQVPMFDNNYVVGLQKKISSGIHTDTDVQAISALSGKSPIAVKAYLEDKALGMATERTEDNIKKKNQLTNVVNQYNSKMFSNYAPDEIFSSSQKTSEFLQKIKREFNPQTLKQNERLQFGDHSFIDNLNNYESLLEDHIVKLTLQEGEKNGESPDVIKQNIAAKTNPESYKKADRAANTPTGINSISDTDISPLKIVGALVDEVFGTKKKDDLLGLVKGEADIKYNRALGDAATDQISEGILLKDTGMIKNGQEALGKVDNDVVYKYPSLIQREIARNVSNRIAQESGQLSGSSVDGVTGIKEKIIGASESDYKRVLKDLGYWDNPKTKEAAQYLFSNPSLFSDASYIGGAVSSFIQPLKDLGLSIGDITGFRNTKDVTADIFKDENFPVETPGIKKSAATIRNIVNTTSNLAGMAAMTVATAGVGAELGMASKVATHLGAYTSFGLPSWDRAYKEAYNFSDNDGVRALYASMNAVVMAEGGRLFDLGKFGKKIPGVEEDLQKLAKGIGEKTMDEQAAKELLGETKNKISDFFVKYGKNVTKGAATMAGFNAAENILKFSFGDPNTHGDEILGNAANAFYGGVLGMSIMGGFGAAADMKNEANTTYKGIIYKAAQNHDALADVFQKGKDNRILSPEMYTQKMSVLEGAKMAKDMVDLAESEKQFPLTENQKSVYVANKTTAGLLKLKLKTTTNENEKERLESQIGRLENQSQEIFDGLKFNQVLEPLYDLHTAEKEYNKAKEDLSQNKISDDEYYAKKDKFEKLQYNYFEGGMEATATANEVGRLLKKGIDAGKISENYKQYVEHPKEFLGFIANQSRGLVENPDGTLVKSPYPGVESVMREEFGDRMVDLALETHPLPDALKEQPAKAAPIIVRHAEAEEQIPGEAENKNPQLTNTGIKQAEGLGQEFKEKGVTQIVTSPVDRSLDTANIASKESGASVRQDERLAGYDPNKESLDEFVNRVNDALGDIRKQGPETAIITHGPVLKMVEALEKNNGDVEAAKIDFDNSKDYGHGESYKKHETTEREVITDEQVGKALSEFNAARKELLKKEAEITATQSKQAGMFGGEQSGMFAMERDEAKSILDPLREKVKEKKNLLEELQKKYEVQETAGEPELNLPADKTDTTISAMSENNIGTSNEVTGEGFSQASINRLDAKEAYAKVAEIDPAVDARGIALEYFANGGKINADTLTEEVVATRKKYDQRGKKSSDVKDRDYIESDGKTIDQLAHSLWDELPEYLQDRVSTEDIRNELISAVSDNNTRLEMAKEYIGSYHPEEIINKQFSQLPNYQKKLAENEYETEQQLEDAYWDEYFKANAPAEEGANSETKSAGGSGTPPSGWEPVGFDNPPSDEWSAIRKEKQIQIDAVREAYEKQGVKAWTETFQNALDKLQYSHPDKPNLYEAAMAEMRMIRAGEGSRAFSADESLAAMQYLKREIETRRSGLFDKMSDNEREQRIAAVAEDKLLAEDYNSTALAIKKMTTEAGRTLNYAQSELGYDPDHGLVLRRMDLMRSKGGEKLTPEEMEWSAGKWEEEKEITSKEKEARDQSMQEKFDKQLQQIKKDYEKKFKEAGLEIPATKKEKTLSQKGKDIADQIRKLKSDKGTLQADITLGLRDLAVEAVATLVETGATIAEAIGKVIKESKFKGITEDQLTNHILSGIERQENRAATYEKIQDYAKTTKSKDVSAEMVAKNFIRDFVNSHIGEYDPKDILDAAYTELKKALPRLTKERLREAYLKEGEFTQPTRKDLETEYSKDRLELRAITKLEEDIDDLKAEREVRVRGNKSEREKDEHEIKLINEKDELLRIKDRSEKEQARVIELNKELDRIVQRKEKEKLERKPAEKKEISDREQGIIDKIDEQQKKWDEEKESAAQLKKDYQKLETERNRQINTVKSLTEKLDNLNKGIREKREASGKKVDTPEIENLKKQIKVADQALRETEKEQARVDREEKNRLKKIVELDAKIRRLKERGELVKKAKTGDAVEVDKTIASMEEKLRKTLTDKGLKISNEDKYTKSSYAERAVSHNDRVDNVAKTIADEISSEGLTDKQKEALGKLNNYLDASKIKLDENSAISQKPLLEQGIDIVKKAKTDFDKSGGSETISKSLQKLIDRFESDKADSEQNIKLQRTKDRLKSGIRENERKINAGEFEDQKFVPLTKSDAELVKLGTRKQKIDSIFRGKQRELESQNKSKLKQAAEFIRAAYVAALIYKFGTLAKVATMALVRPTVESATRLTTGKIFNVLFPSFSVAAKHGGESNSWRTIAKGYEAQFAHYGEKRMEKIYEDANKKYDASEKSYNDYKATVEDIKQQKGVESKEFKQAQIKLNDLKEKMSNNLLDAVGNVVYQFIGGSSYKDALDALLNRSNKVEREFGFLDKETFKGEIVKGKNIVDTVVKTVKEGLKENKIDNINYIIGFIGRSHSALKTFSGRASFASSFIARLESAMADGVDITNSDKLMEIGHESYLDWDRGKYQQSNFVTDTMNKVTQTIERSYKDEKWEKYAKGAGFFLKLDLPITRVPVNILHESVVEYTFGMFKSAFMMANAYRKANREIKMSEDLLPSDKEFKDLLRQNIENMDAKQAATIARCFRKGLFGMGIFATVALMGVAQFGGFYGTDNRKKKPENLKPGELNPGEIMLGDTKQAELVSKIIDHTPALYPALFGANWINNYKEQVESGKTDWQAVGKAVMANLEAMQDAIPQGKFFHPIQTTKDAGAGAIKSISKIWEASDVDAAGNLIERKPFDFKDNLKMLFGHRKEVLTEEYYNQATRVNTAFKKAIQEAYSEKKNQEEIENLKKERDAAIDQIYQLNRGQKTE